jgi:transcriptional regulator with XRE-family HTH domain
MFRFMNTTPTDRVAAELRATIARQNVNQRELAAAIGVDPMWLSRRLRGAVSLSVGDLLRICEGLDIDPCSLIPPREAV